jgi:hypothetical protein
MFTDSEMIFTLDVAIADAPAEAQRLTDWLIASGWARASTDRGLLEPGPRAFATGVVTEKQGGQIAVIAEPTFNMQGADTEAPLCPYCQTRQSDEDFFDLLEHVTDDDPYPDGVCEECGRTVAYTDWPGTEHPIMSNLTLEFDSWMNGSDGDHPSVLLTEIREEMGGRWLAMWHHS